MQNQITYLQHMLEMASLACFDLPLEITTQKYYTNKY
jgi:hypothetical protein